MEAAPAIYLSSRGRPLWLVELSHEIFDGQVPPSFSFSILDTPQSGPLPRLESRLPRNARVGLTAPQEERGTAWRGRERGAGGARQSTVAERNAQLDVIAAEYACM